MLYEVSFQGNALFKNQFYDKIALALIGYIQFSANWQNMM